jgi:hypothetical protein
MATKGRGGDSMLVHMTPEEVQSLQAMALRGGGSLTINPDTGLPEANFLKKLLPAIAGAALNYFVPGLGAAVGGAFGLGAAAGTGIAVGGISALATGSLSRGLMAGLGAYGGASLAGSLAGAGTGALSAEAGNAALAAEGLTGDAALTSAADDVAQRAIGERLASATPYDKMSAGFKAVTDSPAAMGNFAKNNLGAGLAAISPMMADKGVQTTTPQQSTGTIRNYTFDPYGQTYTSAGNYPASEYKGMAQGGIVALAAGGVSDAEIQGWMAANQGADDKTIANAMQQYGVSTDQLSSAMGYNPAEVEQRYAAATAPAGSAAAQYAAANNIDINQQISNWALANPNASDALIDQQMRQYGISNEDVARALGTSGGSQAMEWNTLAGNQGLAGLNQNIQSWLAANPKATREEAEAAMRGVDLNEADVLRATGKSLADLFKPKPIEKVSTKILPPGVGGGGNTVRNPNGTITTTPNIPGRPDGGFTGMSQVRDAYTAGGGSLGYENPYAKDMADFNARFNKQTGSSLAAYEYLMGKGAYPTASSTPGIMRPYGEATLGLPVTDAGRPTQKYLFQNGKYVENPNYQPLSYDSQGNRTVGSSTTKALEGFDALKPAQTQANFDYVTYLKNNQDVQKELDQGTAKFGSKDDLAAAAYNHYTRYGQGEKRPFTMIPGAKPADDDVFAWADTNKVSDAQLVPLMGISLAEVVKRRAKYKKPEAGAGASANNNDAGGTGPAANAPSEGFSTEGVVSAANGGVMRMGIGGMAGGTNARDGLQQINAGTNTVTQAIDTATNALGGVGGGNNFTGINGLFDVMMPGNTQTFRGQNNDNGGPTPYLNLEDRGKTWDYGSSVNTTTTEDMMGGKGSGASFAEIAKQFGFGDRFANGGMALGGLGALAGGGSTAQYNLGGYSDGGRLLRGPGDGVSDSIPATIGNKQPARLADGEFVVPARIVSELGNGSTEAGARKLYAMMDRVQKARGKTTGKSRVAANTRADKYLPA